MKPLHRIVEIAETHPDCSRNEYLEKDHLGLGPPDMVILTKSAKNFSKTYFHHLSGFLVQNEDSLWAYYSSLLSSRPRRTIGGYLYDIPEVIFCCWNSFQGVDVRFRLKSQNHTFSYEFYSPQSFIHSSPTHSPKNSHSSDLEASLNSRAWSELAFSSVFRFWLPSDPLYRSIYEFSDSFYPALRLIPPKSISIDSLRYFLNNYKLCDELYSAISAYLIYLGNSNLILSLVHEFETSHPHLSCHLLHYLPKTCNLSKSLFGYIAEAFYKSPDDPQLVSSFIDSILTFDDDLRMDHLVPFLLSTWWCTPIACIGLSRLCLINGLYEDALLCLNASCYCKKSQLSEKVTKKPFCILGEISFGKTCPMPQIKKFESLLIKNQTEGIYSLFYQTILKFIQKIGPIKIRGFLSKLYPNYQNQRHRAFSTKSSYSGTTTSSDVSDFSDFVDFESKIDASEQENESLNLLFDPGITASLGAPDAMKLLPLHDHFLNILNQTIEDVSILTKENFSENLNCKMESKFHRENLDKIEEACLIALRTRDLELFDQSASVLNHLSKFKMVNKLIGAKIACNLGEIRAIDPDQGSKMTLQEFNTFLVMRELLSGIAELIK